MHFYLYLEITKVQNLQKVLIILIDFLTQLFSMTTSQSQFRCVSNKSFSSEQLFFQKLINKSIVSVAIMELLMFSGNSKSRLKKTFKFTPIRDHSLFYVYQNVNQQIFNLHFTNKRYCYRSLHWMFRDRFCERNSNSIDNMCLSLFLLSVDYLIFLENCY